MPTLNTKVISARVPIKFADELTAYCNSKGISVSRYLQEGFSNNPADGVNFDKIEVDIDLKKTLLAAAGGGALGILTYKGAKWALKNHSQITDNDDIDLYAGIAGVVVGLLSVWGIAKLKIKRKKNIIKSSIKKEKN